MKQRAFMVKTKEAASDLEWAWLQTSSLSAESEGVRSSSAGCTPCGKQNAAASGITGFPGGYANSTCRPDHFSGDHGGALEKPVAELKAQATCPRGNQDAAESVVTGLPGGHANSTSCHPRQI